MQIHLKKLTRKQVMRFLLHSLIIIVGNAVAAAASAFFIEPSRLTMGGTTGLGIFIGKFWDNDFAVSFTIYMVNGALFILGAILLGKSFAIATLAGTVLYPSFHLLWQYLNRLYMAAHDGNPMIPASQPMLAAVIGSIVFGIGIGTVMRVGASTGGTDVPALILHKFFNLPISAGLWTCDLTIITVQFFTTSPEYVFYGYVISLLSSFIIDKVSMIGMKKTQVKIISKKYKEIREMILNDLMHGVTLFYGKTGFLQEKCFIVMTVVSNRELVKLRNEVQKIDPEAFMMVSEIAQVMGRGFSTERIVLPRSEEREDLEEIDDFPDADPR